MHIRLSVCVCFSWELYIPDYCYSLVRKVRLKVLKSPICKDRWSSFNMPIILNTHFVHQAEEEANLTKYNRHPLLLPKMFSSTNRPIQHNKPTSYFFKKLVYFLKLVNSLLNGTSHTNISGDKHHCKLTHSTGEVSGLRNA